MIDYSKVKAGDKLRITGMGARDFASLGDIVTVITCTPNNRGRCSVVNEKGEECNFVLTCGAQRLEPVILATVGGVERIGGMRVPEVEITRSFADPANRIKAFIDCAEMLTWEHASGVRHFMTRARMVCACISDDGESISWKFEFRTKAAAEAFNEGFEYA